MEVRAADVAAYIFERNPPGRAFDLRLPADTSARELFGFCADLLCKGLVLVAGRGDRLDDLDAVTAEDLARVGQKLLCAGIRVRVAPATPPRPPPCVTFFQPPPESAAAALLDRYGAVVATVAAAYEVRFELVRTSPR